MDIFILVLIIVGIVVVAEEPVRRHVGRFFRRVLERFK